MHELQRPAEERSQARRVLELSRVSVSYGNIQAVRDASFCVNDGEFVTLLGPSGSGKTTLLRTIAGFLRPEHGEVYLRGTRVNDVPPFARDIGMVFQNYALFPHMTVGENVAFGLRMRRTEKGTITDRVQSALHSVRLTGYGARYPAELSGGQQQRVAVARAIVIKPNLLLLDEPMSNLDAQLRVQMRFELLEIIEKIGITAVYVTHNQEEALSMSDRIVVMSDGLVRQIGTPEEIYADPQDEFVASFVGQSNLFRCNVVETQDHLLVAQTSTGCAIAAANAKASVGEEILLLVRPEVVELADRHGGVNSFPGIVRHVAYMGAHLEYRVEVMGQLIVVQQSSGRLRSPRTVDSSVSVHWDPEAVVCLGVSASSATG